MPDVLLLSPTTVLPSAEMAHAWLKTDPPARSPSGMNDAASAGVQAKASSAMPHRCRTNAEVIGSVS
jgi:hypothetical protein